MKRILSLFALTLSAMTAAPVQADMLDDIMDVSIRTGWREGGGRHIAALQIDLAPGWKTYWRQPGDAGIPPQFNWSGSKNLNTAQVIWPVPQVSWTQGMRSVGYEGRVILPILFQAETADAIQMKADIEIGVCSDICIPVSFTMNAELPVDGQRDSTIARAIQAQPNPGRGKITCTFAPAQDGMQVTMKMPMPRGGASAAAIEIDIPGIWIGEPEMTETAGQLQLQADILTPSGQPIGINRGSVITSIFAGSSGVEYRGCVGG